MLKDICQVSFVQPMSGSVFIKFQMESLKINLLSVVKLKIKLVRKKIFKSIRNITYIYIYIYLFRDMPLKLFTKHMKLGVVYLLDKFQARLINMILTCI